MYVGMLVCMFVFVKKTQVRVGATRATYLMQG